MYLKDISFQPIKCYRYQRSNKRHKKRCPNTCNCKWFKYLRLNKLEIYILWLDFHQEASVWQQSQTILKLINKLNIKLQKLARQDKLSYKREDKQENLHIVVFSKDGVKKYLKLYTMLHSFLQ